MLYHRPKSGSIVSVPDSARETKEKLAEFIVANPADIYELVATSTVAGVDGMWMTRPKNLTPECGTIRDAVSYARKLVNGFDPRNPLSGERRPRAQQGTGIPGKMGIKGITVEFDPGVLQSDNPTAMIVHTETGDTLYLSATGGFTVSGNVNRAGVMSRLLARLQDNAPATLGNITELVDGSPVTGGWVYREYHSAASDLSSAIQDIKIKIVRDGLDEADGYAPRDVRAGIHESGQSRLKRFVAAWDAAHVPPEKPVPSAAPEFDAVKPEKHTKTA